MHLGRDLLLTETSQRPAPGYGFKASWCWFQRKQKLDLEGLTIVFKLL
jgi:hypothetical protein